MASKDLTTLRSGAPVTAAVDDLVYAVREGQRIAILAQDIGQLGENATKEYTAQVNFDADNTDSLGTMGADIITNGDFATDTDWTKGIGWTISAGAAHCDGTQTTYSYLDQDVTSIAYEYYFVTYTITGRTAGYVRPYLATGAGTNVGTNGTHYTDVLRGVTGDPWPFRFRADSNFDGSISDVSVTNCQIPEWDLDTHETAVIIWDGFYDLPEPLNLKQGGIYTLKIIQTTPYHPAEMTIEWDGVFSWEYDSGRGYWPEDLTFEDGAIDIYTFYCDSHDQLFGIHHKGFS